MSVQVAIVHIQGNYRAAMQQALGLLGGLGMLNTPEREVTIKVGVFDPKSRHHACPEAVGALAEAFDRAPRVRLAESDNYCGPALARLQTCYGDLFNERVVPCSLSDDPQAREMTIAGEVMGLSSALFKPNVFVSIHILRSFTKGSVIKNLFGCTPMVGKAKHHKNEIYPHLLADIAQAAGGIDLAVLDGTFLFHNATEKRVPVDLLIVGFDAAAVETVGAVMAGLKPEKLPQLAEFVRRGLGEGDLRQIEILGISAEEFAGLKEARKALKQVVESAPGAPGLSNTIDALTEEGWMDTPRKAVEVAAELQTRGVTNATKALVETTLKRRAGKTLERLNDNGGWVYRRKQG